MTTTAGGALLVRFSTMMVQDIQNPEYIRSSQEEGEGGDEAARAGFGDGPPQCCCWTERTPIYLVPYPQHHPHPTPQRTMMPMASATQHDHRDQKRPRLLEANQTMMMQQNRQRCSSHSNASTTTTSMFIRAHFYFDQYPSASAQERLKINELVDVVAIRASSSTSLSSSSSPMASSQRSGGTELDDDDNEAMEDDQEDGMAGGENSGLSFGSIWGQEDSYCRNNNETEGEWHVLWYRRRSLYDGMMMMLTPTTGNTSWSPSPPPSRPDFEDATLADQALALLLYSRTEQQRTTTPTTASVVHHHNDHPLVGCAILRWIVSDAHQRDALLRALPAPYTILPSHALTVITNDDNHHHDNDARSLTPRRNPNTGRLRHSPLQLPAGALLVLDLTDLATPGTTTSTTVLSHVVRNLLSTHRLDYCFDGGVRLSFEADYRILVITTPQFRDHDDLLPLNSTFTIDAPPPDCWWGPRPDRIVMKTGLPRLLEHVELPGPLLESVVQAYTTFSTTTTTATTTAGCRSQKKSEALLHRWLIATRSIARYHGRSTATHADFAMACRLEDRLHESVVTALVQ
jgi:hypothetical protein